MKNVSRKIQLTFRHFDYFRRKLAPAGLEIFFSASEGVLYFQCCDGNLYDGVFQKQAAAASVTVPCTVFFGSAFNPPLPCVLYHTSFLYSFPYTVTIFPALVSVTCSPLLCSPYKYVFLSDSASLFTLSCVHKTARVIFGFCLSPSSLD